LTVEAEPAPANAEFLAWAREWLERNIPAQPLPPMYTDEGVEAHRAWERTLFDAGLAAVHWPEEHGGRALDPITAAAFEQDYIDLGGPHRLNFVGLLVCGPTIIEYGSAAQRSRWLGDLLACRAIWSQGFSEPDAGSDLASLRTRGKVGEGRIVVDGQKIWTSLGRWSDWILTLVRTDPEAPRHEGISMIAIDRHSPGLEVRPIRQLSGEEGFAEVFFDGVEVPVENVVGRLNEGWTAAMSLMKHERGTGLGHPAHLSRQLRQLRRIARRLGLEGDRYWRQRLAEVVADVVAYRWVWERDLQLRAAGAYPPELASVNKVMCSELGSKIAETTWELLGPHAELLEDSPGFAAYDGFNHTYWYSRANMISAGSNEIQRSVIAQRWLGLPKARPV
jgi:alkylation response protein AidB-like acyl-CoA dehydrogenase